MTCKICGKDNGWECKRYCCDECISKGNKLIFLVCGILMIIGILIGSFSGFSIGLIQYEYKVNECSSLKSSESSYDFDKTIELDADYNSGCYYINNHPLVLFYHVFVGSIVGILFGIMIPILIGAWWRIRYI